MTKLEQEQKWELDFLKSFFKVSKDDKGIISVGLKDYHTRYYTKRDNLVEYELVEKIFKGEK